MMERIAQRVSVILVVVLVVSSLSPTYHKAEVGHLTQSVIQRVWGVDFAKPLFTL